MEALRTLEGFRKLARDCHFDYRLFKTKEERDVAAFQELENVEEARERFGFTGTRKINLIMWAEDLLKGCGMPLINSSLQRTNNRHHTT